MGAGTAGGGHARKPKPCGPLHSSTHQLTKMFDMVWMRVVYGAEAALVQCRRRRRRRRFIPPAAVDLAASPALVMQRCANLDADWVVGAAAGLRPSCSKREPRD